MVVDPLLFHVYKIILWSCHHLSLHKMRVGASKIRGEMLRIAADTNTPICKFLIFLLMNEWMNTSPPYNVEHGDNPNGGPTPVRIISVVISHVRDLLTSVRLQVRQLDNLVDTYLLKNVFISTNLVAVSFLIPFWKNWYGYKLRSNSLMLFK